MNTVPWSSPDPPASQPRPVTMRSVWLIQLGHFFFGYRDYLIPFMFLMLSVTTVPEFPLGSERLDRWLDIGGLLIAGVGQALRVCVIGFAYIKRGGRNKQIAADTLVREGFFAHSRNPLYLGNMLIIVGLILIANNRWWYFLALPSVILIYTAIIAAEEEFLAKRFGQDYEEYCRQVNRLLPSFTGLRQSLAPLTFQWKRVIQKEYGSTFTWTSTALFLLVWERWQRFGYAAQRAQIHTLVWGFPILVTLYLVARWMKKTGRLGGL